MKNIFLFLSTIMAINASANEVNLLKARDYRSLIAQKWSEGHVFDSTQLGSNLIAGRCFTDGSLQPIGAAFAVTSLSQDGGPLGDSSDLISYGSILINTQNTKYFDELNFGTLTSLERDNFSEINISSTSILLNGFNLRANDDGNIYAVKYYYLGNEIHFTSVCYFYKQNH